MIDEEKGKEEICEQKIKIKSIMFLFQVMDIKL